MSVAIVVTASSRETDACARELLLRSQGGTLYTSFVQAARGVDDHRVHEVWLLVEAPFASEIATLWNGRDRLEEAPPRVVLVASDQVTGTWHEEAREVCRQWAHCEVSTPFVLLESVRSTRAAHSATEQNDVGSLLYDPVTQLPNRTLLLERIGQALDRSKRHAGPTFALLCVDLDRFNLINDGLGHEAGDNLLSLWAERILQCLRPSDTLARLGGDQFVVLLDQVGSPTEANAALKRIRSCLDAPFTLQGTELFVTIGVGVLLGDHTLGSPEQLLSSADVALHRAKNSGPSQTAWFDPAMHANAISRLEMETDLRLALQRGNELLVHYQPIVHLKDSRIRGFEALVRWNHPTRGLLMPGDFISLAEDAGLIVEVGEFVVNAAYRELDAWHEAYADLTERLQAPIGKLPYLAVNLSSRQFRDLAHINRLVERIERSDEQGRIQFEITESLLMDNAEQIVSLLKRLQQSGSSISIDDFGTGYSSLSYLHRFPVDILKIDRAFVQYIDTPQANTGIVRAIINMGHDLGMKVVAEGIETSLQYETLQSLGCEYGQGFFFSHPVTGAQAWDLLAQQLVPVRQV